MLFKLFTNACKDKLIILIRKEKMKGFILFLLTGWV